MHTYNYLILQLIQLIWELESRILVLHWSLGWKWMTSCPYLSNHNLFDPIVIGGWKQTTSCLNFPNDNPIQWTPIIPPPFNSCFRMFLWHWDYPITSVLEAHVCGGDPHVNHNAKISQHGLQNCWIKRWHKFHHDIEFSWESKMKTWHNKRIVHCWQHG